MHDEDELPLSLTPLLIVRRMVAIIVNRGLLLVSLSRMKRNTTMNIGTRARLVKAWKTTLWAKCWTRFPSRPSHTRLKRQYFHQPTFTIYNGRTDPMEHMSHFNQRLAVHSKDEALMCKVFPSSLEPVVMRWFDGQRANSIDSFKELTRTFGSHFITCTRVVRPIDSILSLFIQEWETLKTYSDRY